MQTIARIALGASVCLLIPGLHGCPGGILLDDDDDLIEDDDASGDDDTTGDDDTSGDDDTADDDATGDDDQVDDNTCDEGASASTSMTFVLRDTSWTPLANASWQIRDLDAASGTLEPTAVADGLTGLDGSIAVSLDCADGWMVIETDKLGHVSHHAYFRVTPAPEWPLVVISETMAQSINVLISSGDEGVLGVYKAGTLGAPDLQAADTFSVDGGPDLVPTGAADDVGMWIYDGAYETELFDIWHVDADMPQGGEAGELRFEDASEGHVSLLHAPIWSWSDGGPSHQLTVLYVVD